MQHHEPIPPSPAAPFRPRILVADDESIIAMQIGELLEAEGYELAGVAGTAAQAVDMATRLRPDLVLMDIVMPAGGPDGEGPQDGIDACAMVQSDLNIPVVLLTAHGEEHFLRRARRALPSAYLLKPCQNIQIRAAIEVALALRASNDPAAPFRLREAHHRIKNSFSLLHSMLRIQELQTVDPQARHALADAGARVLALARAHESLSDADPSAGVAAQRHVEALARALFEAQAPAEEDGQGGRVRLELAMSPATLLPEPVIPCGIFLAEAMTNALKHAFPDGRDGVVRVEFGGDGSEAELRVSDSGAGLGGDVEELGRHSFGLQCLQAAANQLRGSMEAGASRLGGASFAVRFPLAQTYQSLSA